jgi:hypothetical protein
MSNFVETYLGAGLGVATFYLLEAVYFDIKARIRGKEYEYFFDELEEETQP